MARPNQIIAVLLAWWFLAQPYHYSAVIPTAEPIRAIGPYPTAKVCEIARSHLFADQSHCGCMTYPCGCPDEYGEVKEQKGCFKVNRCFAPECAHPKWNMD